MTLFIQIAQLICILSILVILHELGHFLPAKYFKTKVEKFYLFFNPYFSLVKKKIGETEYGIGWLPLGGYVKIAGMIDESMDKEQMEQEPQPWEFRSKPAWQRLIIMLGGIIVNVLLAWFIYTCLIVKNGDGYTKISSLTQGVIVSENGEALGLKSGDKIISVDGKKLERLEDAFLEILLADEMTVNRNGNDVKFVVDDLGKKAVLENSDKSFIQPFIVTQIDSVRPNSIAQKLGLQKGDIIESINGSTTKNYADFKNYISEFKKDSLLLSVNRNNTKIEFFTKLGDDGILGFYPKNDYYQINEYNFFSALPLGFKKTVSVLTKQIKQFKLVFNSKVQGYKQVKGPIGLVEAMSPTWDWNFFWNFTAMFSVWLAFVNLLPIPALDGGHAMFLVYELITGKAPSQNVLEKGQMIGFVILMSLMVVIFGNDIWNLIKGYF